MKLGPSGKFPAGRVDRTDRGEIGIAVSAIRSHKLVRVDFGTSLTWFAMGPDQARAFAAELTQRANDLEKPQ